VQRSGGSLQHPGQQLDDELEERAASIEGGAGPEAFGFGFQCLTEDTPDVMQLFAEVVREPALPQDKLELARQQVLSALEHRNDNPSAIPGREVAKLIYGKGSVFARDPTPEQIQSITVEDMRQFLQRWERPDSAVLGIVGDFQPAQMQRLVEECFGSWAPPPGQPSPPPLPNPPLADQGPISGRIFLVDVPGAQQAAVAAGEPGIRLMDRDEYSLQVRWFMVCSDATEQLVNCFIIRLKDRDEYSLLHVGRVGALCHAARTAACRKRRQASASPCPFQHVRCWTGCSTALAAACSTRSDPGRAWRIA
jgi:zinc protease